MLIEKLLQKKIWAVVGANTNPNKYGNIIYNKLKSKNYETYAVNSLYTKIDNDICYENLSSLPKTPDVINFVVSPKIIKPFIDEAAKLNIKYLWFQPGTFNIEIVEYAKKLNFEIVTDCVLVATNNL